MYSTECAGETLRMITLPEEPMINNKKSWTKPSVTSVSLSNAELGTSTANLDFSFNGTRFYVS